MTSPRLIFGFTAVHASVHQHGVVLFTALIFLLVMTLLGTFSMDRSRLESRMAGNARLQAAALGNAELALAAGERQIRNLLGRLPFPDWNNPGDAWYDRTDASTRRIDVHAPDWDFSYHVVDTTSRYVIEYAGAEPVPGNDTSTGCCVRVFLVTAQADAGHGTRRTVQSVYVTTSQAVDLEGGRVSWIDLRQ